MVAKHETSIGETSGSSPHPRKTIGTRYSSDPTDNKQVGAVLLARKLGQFGWRRTTPGALAENRSGQSGTSEISVNLRACLRRGSRCGGRHEPGVSALRTTPDATTTPSLPDRPDRLPTGGDLPQARPGGSPRRTSPREVVNAILYTLRGGQAWRLLPHDFPPWQTVYHYFRRWQAEGVWERIHHTVLMADRKRAGRDASQTGRRPAETGGRPKATASRSEPAIKGALAPMRQARRSRGASGTS